MKKELITVIIPVYNGEDYIVKCIESIESQTYKNLEIIIVNDGSTDKTQEICESLKIQYNNIILINQMNKGVSESRNIGISRANGYYIMFVDSDDYLDKNALEVMLSNNTDKFDFICANYRNVFGEKTVNNCKINEKILLAKEELLKIFWELFNCQLINSPVCRLYKKDIIYNNNIQFNTRYDLGEDLIFNLDYISKSQTFHFIPNVVYNYIYTQHSLTTKYREDFFDIQMNLVEFIKIFMINNKCYNSENIKKIDEYKANIIICSIQNLFLKNANLTDSEINKKIRELVSQENIELLNKIKFKKKRLEFIRVLIVRKKIKLIMVYSKLKEKIKNTLKGNKK